MKNMTEDNFGQSNTYKLYRTVYEIIHPTISKKNISNYKIVLKEELLPLKIFYPKKISKLQKILIYLPGKKEIVNKTKSYDEVCKELVERLNLLVIAIDYSKDEESYEQDVIDCYKTINYLIEELEKLEFKGKNIIVMGDSIGASILANISCLKEENKIEKEILLYPALNLNFDSNLAFPSTKVTSPVDDFTINKLSKFKKQYIKDSYTSPLQVKSYENYPKTLIITGDLDPLRDEGEYLAKNLKEAGKRPKYENIKFATHGFLNSKEEESIEECFNIILKFIAA